MDHQEIRRAIGNHGLWKSRLRRAVDSGVSEFTAGAARVDEACEFGRWLHTLPAVARSSPHYDRVRELHSEFHREAAGVLALVGDGQRAEAVQAIAPRSRFEQLTSELTLALVQWEKAA